MSQTPHNFFFFFLSAIALNKKAFPVAYLPAMWETWVWSLDWEDPLEKGKTTHCNILAWRIPWTVYSMELQRVGRDWATFTSTSSTVYNTLLKNMQFPLAIKLCWKLKKKGLKSHGYFIKIIERNFENYITEFIF